MATCGIFSKALVNSGYSEITNLLLRIGGWCLSDGKVESTLFYNASIKLIFNRVRRTSNESALVGSGPESLQVMNWERGKELLSLENWFK